MSRSAAHLGLVENRPHGPHVVLEGAGRLLGRARDGKLGGGEETCKTKAAATSAQGASHSEDASGTFWSSRLLTSLREALSAFALTGETDVRGGRPRPQGEDMTAQRIDLHA